MHAFQGDQTQGLMVGFQGEEGKRRGSGGEEIGERGGKSGEDRKEMDVVGSPFPFILPLFFK